MFAPSIQKANRQKTWHCRKSRFVTAIGLVGFLTGLYAAANSVNAQDHTVPFSTSDAGVSKPVAKWGLDTAWINYNNMRRGVIYMGADQVNFVRVTFPVNSPIVNGTLTSAQLADVNTRIGLANLAGTNKPLTMTTDTGAGVDASFKNGTSQVIPANWVAAMDATVNAYTSRGRTFAFAAPFNEPDYGWNQGTLQNLYDICGLLQTDSVFANIPRAGGSTLSCDSASTWYNKIKSRATTGTTHQLGGSFNGYVGFYQNVIASGGNPVNEEVHSLVEVIAGAQYGLTTGIWWGTAERARGGFVQACKGMQLAYSEDRTKFSAAAVYRAPSGAVQAFLGNSERQGVATTYRFASKDRDVFYDGYGPRRDYTVNILTDQDKVVNIAWGADVPPPVNGRYIVVNRNSGKALSIPGASTAVGTGATQNSYTGATNQQWDIAPFSSTYGDQSFCSINAAHDGLALDLNNYSYNAGGTVQQYTDAGSDNQKWFFDYAGNGFFYIRSRWSGLYLGIYGASQAEGGSVVQWTSTGSLDQQWRLMPVGAAVEFVAPAAPSGLTATANAVSVRLTWNANTEPDLAGYAVFRSTTAGGPYDTIARGVTTNVFTDKDANQNKPYYYVVKAVDFSVNQSGYSAEVNATPTGGPTLVARYNFDGTTSDSAGNGNDIAVTGAATYGTGQVGTGALVLDGASNYANLPATIANYSQMTIAAWIYWNGGAAWQRIFDFGTDTGHFMFLTPTSGSAMQFSIANGGAGQNLTAPALPAGQWVHVAISIGSQSTQLYVNGVNVASSTAIIIKPSDVAPVLNYIGKSQFTTDPLFNGKIDDFEVYNSVLSGTQIAALASQTPVATANPLAYLKFDETTGTAASDATGNGWNATLVNSPTWTTGVLGNALNFASASSQYATLPGGLDTGVADYTISTWVNLTSSATWARVFDFGTGAAAAATTGAYMYLTVTNGSAVQFAITTSGYNSEQKIIGTAPLPTGGWCHVAVTWTGNTGKLYVNGTRVGTNTMMTLNPSYLGGTTVNYLGRSRYAGNPYLNGSLDDFRVYTRALGADEITALTAAGTLSAPPVNLVATPGPGQIQLAWSSVANAISYTVNCAAASGGPYTTIASGLTSPGYTHGGLNYGATYYYVVAASNSFGTSPNSAEASAAAASALITSAETSTIQVAPAVQPGGGSVASVTIPSSVAGHSYQVQYTIDLTNGSWSNLGDPQAGTGSAFTFSLPAVPASNCGFYRVVVTR